MSTVVRKWGNSLGIRVPKDLAERVNFDEGTEVELEATGGVLTVRPKRRPRRRKYRLSELLAKAKGPSPHRALFNDPPVGREML